MNDFILGVVAAVVVIFVIATVVVIVRVYRKVRALESNLRAQDNTVDGISRHIDDSIAEIYRQIASKENDDSLIIGDLRSYIDSRFDKFENKLKQKKQQ